MRIDPQDKVYRQKNKNNNGHDRPSDMNSRLSLFLLPVLAAHSFADLQPMEDTAMDEMVGQAYIEMDAYDNGSNTLYNRITFGQTIKIQSNADEVVFGEAYDQATNTYTGQASDTDLNLGNVSLGYIDGTGAFVPMVFSNPYIEFAKDSTTNDMLGFRIGFEEAEGKLQADFTTFSGQLGVLIDGNVTTLHNSVGGASTNSRATMIGFGGCTTAGTNCWDIGNINAVDVGDSSGTGPTGDFFLSFQKDNTLQWRLADSSMLSTGEGFFMNIPTSNDFSSAEMSAGTASFTTEFIDRGVGRFIAP